MKKIRNIFGGIISIILIGGIIQQWYYRVQFDGNLVFYITNQSLIDSPRLEVFVDGIKILDDKVEGGIHSYKSYPVKTTLGDHTVLIKINGEFSEMININTFLVTFMIVSYYGDQFDGIPGCEDIKHINIEVQKCLRLFIA